MKFQPKDCYTHRHASRTAQLLLASSSALLLAGVAQVAVAQPSSSSGKLEEVVVTAQKRGVVENAQDVPIAIYGFSADTLDKAMVYSMADLGLLVPAADLPPTAPIIGFANFTIRGMGTIGTLMTEDPTVSVVVDSMPLGISAGGVLDIYDLESAEVLAGPQGTLFGRNSTGGAVVLRTRRASGEPGGNRVDVGVGNFGHQEIAAALETATDDGAFAGRLAFQYKENGDIFDNVAGEDIGEREFYIVRPSVRWNPADSVTVDLVAEFGKDQGDGPASRNIYDERTRVTADGFVPPRDDFDLALNTTPTNDMEWSHLIAEVNWEVAGGVLTSVTGLRGLEQDSLVDTDGSSLSIFDFNPFIDQEQFSQEIRWSGMVGESLNLTTGAYFFSQELDYKERRVIFGGAVTPALTAEQNHDQWAFFAQGTYDINSSVALIAGLRYTQESKDIEVASFGNCDFEFTNCTIDQDLDETWDNVGAKLGVNWRVSDDLLTWMSWTRSFRSGGFNGRNGSPELSAGPFDEETVDAFELGSKWEFLDGAARLNAALYRNEYDDLQRTVLGADNLQTIDNAAAATISGAELDFAWSATDQLTIYGGFSYVDADYDEFDNFEPNIFFPPDDSRPDSAEDLDFFNVAKYTASGSVTYDGIDLGSMGSLSLRAAGYWRDEFPADIRNYIIYDTTLLVQASATLRLPGDKLTLTLWGKNLTDEQFGQGAVPTSLFFVDFIAPPRTYGARLSYQF
ncbi:MAG: iron complex outermembrane receptor protein [Alcanivorax sp.]|jgi:iron complex outermembrane receptor protein